MTLLKRNISWQMLIIGIICLAFVFGSGFIGLYYFNSLTYSVDKHFQDIDKMIAPLISKNEPQAQQEMTQKINQVKQKTDQQFSEIKIFMIIFASICIGIIIFVFILAYYAMKRTMDRLCNDIEDALKAEDALLSFSTKIDLLQPLITAINNLLTIKNQLYLKLSLIPVPIIELDDNLTIRFINTSGHELFGSNKTDVIGKPCHEIVQSDRCADKDCPCKQANQSASVISVETRIQTSNQSVPVDLTVVPFTIDENNKGSILCLTNLGMMGTIVEEVKRITSQLNTTLDELAQMNSEIKDSTEDIVNMSEQSATSIDSMATMGEEMSTNVSSQADSVLNLTTSLKEVAKNTEKANQISRDANAKTDEVNTKMQALVNASEQIGKVITVINDIADRTDLLALNAAIEAEGAGIAGKGFAVVADEVQKLAKQSADATDEIAQEIENIQISTQDAVQAMEQISTIIDEIAAINESNASAVHEQTQTATRISDHTNQNVQTGQAVANSASDVLSLVNNISVKIKQTASKADATNNASEELAEMATELMNSINQLKF